MRVIEVLGILGACVAIGCSGGAEPSGAGVGMTGGAGGSREQGAGGTKAVGNEASGGSTMGDSAVAGSSNGGSGSAAGAGGGNVAGAGGGNVAGAGGGNVAGAGGGNVAGGTFGLGGKSGGGDSSGIGGITGGGAGTGGSNGGAGAGGLQVGPGITPWSCNGTNVTPTDDIVAIVNAAATGTTVCIGKGLYRMAATLVPKASVTLWGEPGAILNGSRVLTSWTAGTGNWYAAGQLPAAYTGSGDCEDNVTYPCRLGEQLFRDNVHLDRVMALADLKPGAFYADYAANRVYVADDPSGHLMEQASLDAAISSSASGVTIRGLVVEKCANQAQEGAIRVNGARWNVSENEVRSNHGTGIRVYGSDGVVAKNHVHHNGQLGIGGNAVSGLVIENNLITDNNTDGFWINDWESGGIKFCRSAFTIRGNHVLDNRSIGVWLDIDCKGVLIENNVVTGNWADGIRYEISYDVKILGNTVKGNALRIGRNGGTTLYYGAGITVHSSANVEVANNVVDGNLNGISLQARNRGTGDYGTWVLVDATVHDNDISMDRGQTGMVQNLGAEYYTTKGNRFFHNTYRLDSLSAKRFQWQDAARTKDEWQGYGQDTDGTFLPK